MGFVPSQMYSPDYGAGAIALGDEPSVLVVVGVRDSRVLYAAHPLAEGVVLVGDGSRARPNDCDAVEGVVA